MWADSGYKKQAWEYAAQAIRKKAKRPNIELKQIKLKHDSYKKDYKAQVKLKSQLGFRWDKRGYLTALKKVLDDYFKANPDIRKFRYKPLELKDLHHQLFTDIIATGK